jgi:hypothetical protein
MIAPDPMSSADCRASVVNQRFRPPKSFQFVSISRDQDYQLVAKRHPFQAFLDTVNPGVPPLVSTAYAAMHDRCHRAA